MDIEYLKPVQYAKKWNLSYSLVNRCIHNGRLNAIKIGKRTYRIREDEPIREEGQPKKLVRFDFEKELANL